MFISFIARDGENVEVHILQKLLISSELNTYNEFNEHLGKYFLIP